MAVFCYFDPNINKEVTKHSYHTPRQLLLKKFSILMVACLALVVLFMVAGSHNSQRVVNGDHICDEAAHAHKYRGPLLATDFNTLEELQEVVTITYLNPPEDTTRDGGFEQVTLEQCAADGSVRSVLTSGVKEDDFRTARNGNLLDKMSLAFRTPYALLHRKDIFKVYFLSRRKHLHYGPGDAAFYDFAELMVENISSQDKNRASKEELGEKGYLNSFNHVSAQAFVTMLFSEALADYVADVHERQNMPELISGKFSKTQLASKTNHPVDNYVDMINNEWGQELGKKLRNKHGIQRDTKWTPALLAAVLNDMQSYFSWSFGVGFTPFSSEKEKVIRFSKKLNAIMAGELPER